MISIIMPNTTPQHTPNTPSVTPIPPNTNTNTPKYVFCFHDGRAPQCSMELILLNADKQFDRQTIPIYETFFLFKSSS